MKEVSLRAAARKFREARGGRKKLTFILDEPIRGKKPASEVEQFWVANADSCQDMNIMFLGNHLLLYARIRCECDTSRHPI